MSRSDSAPPAGAALVLPIFPLPDVTFFPHTFLPLHVFEARYRAMVTDALARDRRLCVVKLQPGYEAGYDGKPAVASIAGAGEIVNWERQSNGRYNILLKGQWRIRIQRELPSDTLYRLVRAERLEDEPPGRDLTPQVSRIRVACHRLLDALQRPPDTLDSVLAADQPPGVIMDRLAAAVLPEPALRQELLETLAVERRVTRVAEALDAIVEKLTGGTR